MNQTQNIKGQCKVQAPIYRGLHLALENVAERFPNNYYPKIWRYKQKSLTLYPENESERAFNI